MTSREPFPFRAHLETFSITKPGALWVPAQSARPEVVVVAVSSYWRETSLPA